MCDATMHGTCDICGKTGYVERTYYHYGFKCECHSPNHFVSITHCPDCIPKRPVEMRVLLTDEQAQYIGKAVAFYEKYKEEHKDE